MKRILLLLTFLIPLISFAQKNGDNINWCGFDDFPPNNTRIDPNGPYTEYDDLTPKIIPVVMTGVNFYDGQFDNYAECEEIADSIIYYLNLYFSGGFEGSQLNGHVPSDPTPRNSLFWFVKASKDPGCVNNPNIAWQSSDDLLGQDFPVGNQYYNSQFLYEPFENLNVVWAKFNSLGVLGYSYVQNSNGDLGDSGYGIYMQSSLFDPEHDLPTGPAYTLTPLQYTAVVLAHEAGHWLGLYHTFRKNNNGNYNCDTYDQETDCNTEGDKVCDTPVDVLEYQCGENTLCDGALNPSILDETNFMSYRFRRCAEGRFTENQISRAHDHVADVPMLTSVVDHGSTCYFDPDTGLGCTDITACNYNPWATTDDGSCEFPDMVNDCGGDCTADIDGDFICDDLDNCTDTSKCNYNSPSNLTCVDIDECGVCGGPGAILDCGCYDLVFPYCECDNVTTLDFNNDGICDNLNEYPDPGGNQLDVTLCAIPNDIAITIDASGSITETSDAYLNGISIAKQIINHLYLAILENKVRVSLSLWGDPRLNDSPTRRGSKVIVPLHSGQAGWNVLNSALDYIQNTEDVFEYDGPLLGDDSQQPMGRGTVPKSMFGASYITLTDEDYYIPGRIKNIISITDSEWDFDSPCNSFSFSDDNVLNSITASNQIKNGVFIDLLEDDVTYTWPIPGDNDLSPAIDSVRCRIIGIGFPPGPDKDEDCWLEYDYPNLVDLSTNSSTFVAFSLEDISSITDSLTILCEVPGDECPIIMNNSTVSVNDQDTVQIVLYGNLSYNANEYYISLIDNTGQWYELSQNEFTITYDASNSSHTYEFEIPSGITFPTNLKIIYRSLGFECEELLTISCDEISGYESNEPTLDIFKNGFGFFSPTQDKVRIVGIQEYLEVFVSPVNECGVLGLSGSEIFNAAGFCFPISAGFNQHSVDYAIKVLPEHIISTNEIAPPLKPGNAHEPFGVNDVLEIDLTTYLQAYDMQIQDMAVIVFPLSNSQFPEIDENNFFPYENEFDALISEYSPGSIVDKLLNNRDGQYGYKTQCVQAFVLDKCDDIAEQTHLLLFNNWNNEPIGSGQAGNFSMVSANWPNSDEYFLLYQGVKEMPLVSDPFYEVIDPYMTTYNGGSGGVSLQVNGQTFYPERIIIPLQGVNPGPVTAQYKEDIGFDSPFGDDVFGTSFTTGAGTNVKDYIFSQIPQEVQGKITNFDPMLIRYVPGLRQYLEDNNISVENVNIVFPHGCSTNPPIPVASGPCNDETTITYSGYTYGLVEIGNRCWFDRELRTEVFSNGDSLNSVSNSNDWISKNQSGDPAWTYPSSTEDVFWNEGWSTPNTLITDRFLGGRLYNWWTTIDGRGICPVGYHVSNNTDWNDLENTVFGTRYNKINGQSNAVRSDNVIEDLQVSGLIDDFNISYPNDPTSMPNGRSIEGFADETSKVVLNQAHGLVGGIRVGVDGTFRESRTARYWWTSDSYPNKSLEFNRQNAAWSRGIKIVPDLNNPTQWDNSNDGLSRYRDLWSTSQNKGNGLFIRCVKNLPE